MLDEIDLYLTNRCNLKCDFCSVQARNPMDELPLKKIFEIVDEAKKLGMKELHLTGGEPTLRDDLEEIVKYAVRSGLNTRLITNGTTLSKERLEKLYALGLRSIMISLDGNKDYHNNERGADAFEKAINTIKNAVALNMFVRVNSVAWTDNINHILALPKFLDELGVKVYSIFLGSPLGYAQARKHKVVSPYKWREFCSQIKTSVLDLKIKVVVEKGFLFFNEDEYDVSDFSGRGRGCIEINKYEDFFLIRCNGDVYPCVFFSNEAPAIGNVNESTLKEILENFKENDFYNCVGRIPAQCNDCSKALLCKGGCKGYSKLIMNEWYGKDPRCSVASAADYIPLCPIVKINITDDIIGGSSEQVL